MLCEQLSLIGNLVEALSYRDVNEDGLALIYIDRYVGHFPVR